jgi:hypothetical protein
VLTGIELAAILGAALVQPQGAVLRFLAEAGLLPPGQDDALDTPHVATVVLALLGIVEPRHAAAEAHYLAGFEYVANFRRRAVGGAVVSEWLPKSAVGNPLGPTVAEAIDAMRTGGFWQAGGAAPYRLCRVRDATGDLVFLETYRRAGEAAVVEGLVYAATNGGTLRHGALSMRIEVALDWLLIRELAERLGPLPAAAADPVGDAPAMELRAN